MRLQDKGFSLIELLVVMAIVAVLVAVTVPAYKNYMLRSNRTDAIQSIMATQIAQEQYRLNSTSYGSMAQIAANTNSLNGHYVISTSGVTTTAYVITAVPAAGDGQNNDTGCTSMTLTYSNNTPTNAPANCWS